MSPNVRKSASIAIAIVALSCAATYTHAQTVPAQKTENGVTYITGGIGSDESQGMRDAAGTTQDSSAKGMPPAAPAQ
jgi:hypothetical protein